MKADGSRANGNAQVSYDDVNQITDVSSAYRVPKGTVIKGWEVFSFPATHVVRVAFKGDPSNSGEAHAAIAEYLKEKTLDYSMVIEEYQLSSDQVKKRSDCVTNIYYLLKPKFSITLGK